MFGLKKGQTSVEYLLMIALIASIVFGLLAFSGRVEQIIAGAKIGARNKLSGSYPLSRKDFAMGGLSFKDDGSGDGGDGGAGGGAGGGKGRGRRGNRGGAGGADGLGGPGSVTSPGAGVEDGTGKGGAEDAGTGQSDYQGQRVAGGAGADQGYEAIQADRRARGRRGEEAGTAEGQVGTEDEEEGEEGSIVMRRQEGTAITKTKTLAEKDWGIGKFLIILVVLIFIIIFILKARQARD